MADTSTTIFIPGKATIFRTVDIPDEAIALPLHVGSKRLVLMLAAALCGALAMIAFASVWPLFSIVTAPVSSGQPTSMALVHGLLAIAIALVFPLAGVTAFADAIRPGPTLSINQDGVSDARAGVSIPWSSVVAAKVSYWKYGPVNVMLTLNQPISANRNPMRLGGGLQWRRSSAQLCIPLLALDHDPDFLARLLVALARSKGCEIRT